MGAKAFLLGFGNDEYPEFGAQGIAVKRIKPAIGHVLAVFLNDEKANAILVQAAPPLDLLLFGYRLVLPKKSHQLRPVALFPDPFNVRFRHRHQCDCH